MLDRGDQSCRRVLSSVGYRPNCLGQVFAFGPESLKGKMDYINLGKTGLKVSRIGLGCMTYGAPATGEPKGGRHAWSLNEADSQPFLRQALDLGINFFDT